MTALSCAGAAPEKLLGKCQRQPRKFHFLQETALGWEGTVCYLSTGIITQPLKEAARGSGKAEGFNGEGSTSLP